MKAAVAAAAFVAAAFSTTAHAQSFSGLYAGVEGGMDHYELSADLDVEDIDYSGNVSLDGLSGNGVVGGVFAGYQHALGRGFASFEGFASMSGASISMGESATDGVDTYHARIKAEAQESYGIAGRLGVRLNTSTALYGRLGWVNTQFSIKGSCDVPDYCFGIDSYKETIDGVQYGAGLETMVSPRAALRLEYVISDYGDADLGEGASLENGSVRAGLSYRF